ncbi:hypothetical protein [Haloplasma contractile]|uniref:Uncharacterized protein n=1 Tax=Haloplasma contractile SSD-17B TaxID=1033810 RepID=F7PVB0_9MOLU|nr:hypothetical protein [Haloplasma contractile]ERJ12925.1 hypothetical protein HLPCO_001265 [Haloplasma contractile SSD-17B]
MEKEQLKAHHNDEMNELIEEEVLLRHHPNTIKLFIDYKDKTAYAEAKSYETKELK